MIIKQIKQAYLNLRFKNHPVLDDARSFIGNMIKNIPREEWVETIKPYITRSDNEYSYVLEKDGYNIYEIKFPFTLKELAPGYTFQFKIGDVVSYKNKGIYVITELPYLDSRFEFDESLDEWLIGDFISELGNKYDLEGLDENNCISGTQKGENWIGNYGVHPEYLKKIEPTPEFKEGEYLWYVQQCSLRKLHYVNIHNCIWMYIYIEKIYLHM